MERSREELFFVSVAVAILSLSLSFSLSLPLLFAVRGIVDAMKLDERGKCEVIDEIVLLVDRICCYLDYYYSCI